MTTIKATEPTPEITPRQQRMSDIADAVRTEFSDAEYELATIVAETVCEVGMVLLEQLEELTRVVAVSNLQKRVGKGGKGKKR